MTIPWRALDTTAGEPDQALASPADAAFIGDLRRGAPRAVALFCDRYSDHVLRVLGRILGDDPELADLHHDVFVHALGALRSVRDAAALKGWITIIAANVARSALKRRIRRRWLRFLPWEELPDLPARAAPDEAIDAVRRTYVVLDQLPMDDRVAFALRVLEGMGIAEVADACSVSVATVKRRVARAERRFRELAAKDPVLAELIDGEATWTTT